MNLLEVKPREAGWYYVTLFKTRRLNPEDKTLSRAWVEFKNNKWNYGTLLRHHLVILIHLKEDITTY